MISSAEVQSPMSKYSLPQCPHRIRRRVISVTGKPLSNRRLEHLNSWDAIGNSTVDLAIRHLVVIT